MKRSEQLGVQPVGALDRIGGGEQQRRAGHASEAQPEGERRGVVSCRVDGDEQRSGHLEASVS